MLEKLSVTIFTKTFGFIFLIALTYWSETGWNCENYLNFSDQQITTFISNLSSLYSALLGFVISTMAIMATVLEFKNFRPMHESGQTKKLLASFASLCWITLLSCILAMFSNLILTENYKKIFALNIIGFMYWLLVFYNCMRTFHAMLKQRYSTK
jgi:hypothetical protein